MERPGFIKIDDWKVKLGACDFTILSVIGDGCEFGEIDCYTAPILKDRLHKLIDQGARHIVVDLSSVRYLDASGLHVLNNVRNWCEEHAGSVFLVGLCDLVYRLFHITRFDSRFTIWPELPMELAKPAPTPTPTPVTCPA